jgi:hypothetical protein
MKKVIFILLTVMIIPTYLKSQITQVDNVDIPGGNYKHFELKPGETCQACIDACLKDPNCKAYTYVKPGVQGPNAVCWLKSTVSNPISDLNCISGVKIAGGKQSAQMVNLDKPIIYQQVEKGNKQPVQQVDLDKSTISQLENQNIPGGDYNHFELKPGETCQTCIDACLKDPNCKAYTYVKPGVQGPNAVCWLKSTVSNPVPDPNCISGIKVIGKKQTDLEAAIDKPITMISLISKMPADAPSFFASTAVELLAKQLSTGQTLGNQNTDSKDFNFHYNWAKTTNISRLMHELNERLNTMMDLKVEEGNLAKASWYAKVCAIWAKYGIDFGSPGANSTNEEDHKNWATGTSPYTLKGQIKLRLDKIFSKYGLVTVPGKVESWCEKLLAIPGLVIGMSNFAKDGGNKCIPPDYIGECEVHYIYDLNPVIGRIIWTEDRLEFFRLPSSDNDDPYAWTLPPGIVLGLTYNAGTRNPEDKVFGYYADQGPVFLGGNRFRKWHGGDRGAASGEGWYWYESTGEGFTDWDIIQCLPRGTVVGLAHSINQKGKEFIWNGYTYDASNPEFSPPPGFLRRHYGDMGAPENQGYSWYEKITDSPIY